MSLTRRALLAASLPAALAPALAGRAFAASADPRLAPRAMGNPNAKVIVEEWFSFTCPHCARFELDIFPEVRKKLIDTGRIRYVFCDFPLDRSALIAAQVARSLPEERYEPFMTSLFSNLDRWAYGENVNPEEQLRKMAGLAGMSPAEFDTAVNDTALQNAILAEQQRAETEYKIDSTPTFRFNKEVYRQGELTFAAFEQKVAAAGG
ncbi:DsbA family protein [Acetobacter conturbans]|uniref:Thioredoxin domain-containing protein n=1 Tax=Acetobacter conturbans TaxID=1737472 RepID=A0ABX0JXK5_9PROT|nr:thioredoxin domain-containing protein [Acetobacter conturbans]NHN88186.1 thioredoxin domain-containing protein [Acetobacter conturbans]